MSACPTVLLAQGGKAIRNTVLALRPFWTSFALLQYVVLAVHIPEYPTRISLSKRGVDIAMRKMLGMPGDVEVHPVTESTVFWDVNEVCLGTQEEKTCLRI